jgi:hypothetical protein
MMKSPNPRTSFLWTSLLAAASVCPLAAVAPAAPAAPSPETRPAAAPAGEAVAPLAPLTVEEFDRLHREVRPPDGEVWRSIPWKTSILDAVAEARQTGRPVLLITTNGHLLGCG